MGQEKTFHFLAGLPRSGNTLLSSILNQHPQVYSGAISPVFTYLYYINYELLYHEANITNDDVSGTLNVIDNMLPLFYKNVEKPVIFDNQKIWGVPAGISIIKQHLTPNPKIIFTVRPMLEILASYVKLFPNFPAINESMKINNWVYKDYLTEEENKCDFLMRPGGDIDRILMTYGEIIKPENKGVFHIVEYNKLIDDPVQTMKNIYNFIEVENYNHDYKNINNIHNYFEERIGAPKNLHEIRKTLEKPSTKPEDILSDYILSKYSKLDFYKTM